MLSDPGVAAELKADELKPEWFTGCDAIYLSGYALMRTPADEAVAAAARAVHDEGGVVAVDVSTWTSIRAFGPERFLAKVEELAAARRLRQRGGARDPRPGAVGRDVRAEVRRLRCDRRLRAATRESHDARPRARSWTRPARAMRSPPASSSGASSWASKRPPAASPSSEPCPDRAPRGGRGRAGGRRAGRRAGDDDRRARLSGRRRARRRPGVRSANPRSRRRAGDGGSARRRRFASGSQTRSWSASRRRGPARPQGRPARHRALRGAGRDRSHDGRRTLAACEQAGVRFFATGGIGGVHRGWTERPDVSADLAGSRPPPCSSSARGSSRCSTSPRPPSCSKRWRSAARLADGGAAPLLHRGRRPGRTPLDTAEEAARVARAHWALSGLGARRRPRAADGIDDVEPLIEEALADASKRGVRGRP